MTNKALEALTAELNKVKAEGHSALAVDALISYVEGLQQPPLGGGESQEEEQQRVRLNFEGQLERYKVEHQWGHELFKATIEAGQSALRALSTVNGAAAVAILAFLGHVLANSGRVTMPSLVSGMRSAMAVFAFGVGFAALAFVARYLSQASYGSDFWSPPNPQKARRYGDVFRIVAIVGGALSLLAFFGGVYIAAQAI